MRWLPVLLVGAIAAVAPDLAGACSCADTDPRDRLEAGEVALIGRVVAARPPAVPPSAGGTESTRYVVRVKRGLNARLPRELTLRGDDISSCAFRWRVGERVGAFLNRTRSGWATHLCSLADPDELERALRPYPRPVGRGRLALLAGGHFGDARLMALDRRGRILGYGSGRGSVRRISVCPGGRVAAELVDLGTRRSLVAVRSLETLTVTSASAVPRATRELVCADAAGSTVYTAALHYSGRPVRGRMSALRINGSVATTVARRPAEQLSLGPGTAYAWSRGRLLAVSLVDGSTRTVLRARLFDSAAVSDDGSRLAMWSFDRRLRIVDLATGAVASRRTDYAGELTWLSADRLLVRVGGTARIYDGDLQPLRSYRFYRAFGQAHVDGTLFGTDRYRLVGLDLESGRKRRLAELPDRGIAALAAVPDGPELNLPRRAPAAGPAGERAPDRGRAPPPYPAGSPRRKDAAWTSSSKSFPSLSPTSTRPRRSTPSRSASTWTTTSGPPRACAWCR